MSFTEELTKGTKKVADCEKFYEFGFTCNDENCVSNYQLCRSKGLQMLSAERENDEKVAWTFRGILPDIVEVLVYLDGEYVRLLPVY